jgi:hypothetical protein
MDNVEKCQKGFWWICMIIRITLVIGIMPNLIIELILEFEYMQIGSKNLGSSNTGQRFSKSSICERDHLKMKYRF